MGGQKCPNCTKGHLLRTSRGTKRCKWCGYTTHDSPNRKSFDPVESLKREKSKEKEIPVAYSEEEERERHRRLPKGEGYQTDDYQDRKFIQDEYIRDTNRRASIEKILKKLRKNKYNPIKTVILDGEVWDVETGKPLKDKEKDKEAKAKEFSPDRIIEEMVEAESG